LYVKSTIFTETNVSHDLFIIFSRIGATRNENYKVLQYLYMWTTIISLMITIKFECILYSMLVFSWMCYTSALIPTIESTREKRKTERKTIWLLFFYFICHLQIINNYFYTSSQIVWHFIYRYQSNSTFN